jgi:SPP1 family phage portal protein
VYKLLKAALIENAMGYDAKDERMGGNANQMNILSMYADIDLDANAMEAEIQHSIDQLFWFYRIHLANTKVVAAHDEKVTVTFNRDLMMNEADVMDMLYKGGVRISNETLLAQVPFIQDVALEQERLTAEKAASFGEYPNTFPIRAVMPNAQN